MKKKSKKFLKFFWGNDLQGGGGVSVPIGIFPNINIHKNIDCHLKT